MRDPILQGLEGVVDEPRAAPPTATFTALANFSLARFPIAGKTGTASQRPRTSSPTRWFVGFGPATHPKYVVLCVIDQGGYGADAAAPVVAETFNYLVAHPITPVSLSLDAAPLRPPRSTTTTTTAKDAGLRHRGGVTWSPMGVPVQRRRRAEERRSGAVHDALRSRTQ